MRRAGRPALTSCAQRDAARQYIAEGGFHMCRSPIEKE